MLNKQRWQDFVKLFGEKGACGGCWCMSWRLKKADFEQQKGEGNKQLMRQLVDSGAPTGIIGYVGGKPIGWCSVAPREQYLRLQYSRILKPVDTKPVWSIVCIFLTRDYRRKGLSTELIKAAVEYCKFKGCNTVEAYPTVPYSDKTPAAFLWSGVPESYYKAGFKLAEQRSKWKIILRCNLDNAAAS